MSSGSLTTLIHNLCTSFPLCIKLYIFKSKIERNCIFIIVNNLYLQKCLRYGITRIPTIYILSKSNQVRIEFI
jgi:hypothetical protein